MTLRQKIEREIQQSGPIRFSRYMEICLYDPEQGYYSRHAEQFGKAGDFYTSSDVHAVFGRLLARQFQEMWKALGSPEQIEIRELGPGRGLFAQDVLDWSEKRFPNFFSALHYSLAEGSAALRWKLQATLARHFDIGRVSFATGTKPDNPVLVFANEFFDALPVEVISAEGVLHVSVEAGRFVEQWIPVSAEELEFIDRYGVHPGDGERIEVPLTAQKYMSGIAATINTGFMLVIDYGYTRNEQLRGRHRGTISTFRQHSSGLNPFEAPGDQDITAYVNFTALAAAAEQKGMDVQPLVTQSQFLMGIGEANQFADAFEECRLPQERAKVALQLKHLITPEGMGESFQVFLASKGIDSGKAAALSGLNFGNDRLSNHPDLE